MSQLEDEIEFHCRNRNLPLLSQHHPMRELLFLHHLVIFLKLSVMPEAQQEDRPIMHFHLHTLIRWELDVVIERLFMRRDRTDKGQAIRIILSYIAAIILLPIALLCKFFRRKYSYFFRKGSLYIPKSCLPK